MNIKEYYALGDLKRYKLPKAPQVPIYLGSGRAGVCIDGYGLMNPSSYPETEHDRIALTYRHTSHYHRGECEMERWVSLYKVAFNYLPEINEEGYFQHLDLYKGQLTTSYTLKDGTFIKITDFFSLSKRDTFAVLYEYKGSSPDIIFSAERDVKGWYRLRCKPELRETDDGFTAKTNTTETRAGLKIISEKGKVKRINGIDTVLKFTENEGRHLLLFTAENISRYDEALKALSDIGSIDEFKNEAALSWEKGYGDAFCFVPDEFINIMTSRSVYYMLCSFASGDNSPSAPMGWTEYGWGYHFPQDISFIHPALLRLGLTDLAKAIVDYYRKTLEDTEKYTKRVFGGKGSMWAWEYPIHTGGDRMTSGCPDIYQYEIHNAAYPARMAYETALQLNDFDWLNSTAKPIIKSSAEFYASHMTKEKNGKWSLLVTPSCSQDEYAEPNKPNYLCSLYAARYCFDIAVKLGMNEFKVYLDDGLSFDKLIDSEEKLYKTSEGMKKESWGKEKHPVQFNPIIFLPKGELDSYEINSYKRREFICADTKVDNYIGWTLGAFEAAASHMGDGEGLLYELKRAEDFAYIDPDKLGFYEASNLRVHPYYVTTHGLWLQAVLDAFVNDFDGETKLAFAVPKEWKGAEYRNLCTKDGKKHSGKID